MLRTQSFPVIRRIRERPEFQKVFRRGKRLYSSHYILYYFQSELDFPRMGVVTSKRNVRKAVQRNRVKRVARELFRQQQSEMKPVDIVLVAQKKANEASKEELRQCLKKLFAKL